jgi:hypothetical protein
VKPARRIMGMTSREVDVEGEHEHERRLARYEREQDRLAAEERDEPTVGDLEAYARLRADLEEES